MMCLESKYGLSTYYIEFLHAKNFFDDMIDRIGEMDLHGSSSIKIIGFGKTLKKEWQNRYELFTWEYVKNHLKQSGKDQLNCCTFALRGNCEHSHQNNSCITCLNCFSFFKSKILPFLNNANDEVYSNDKDEVSTMMDAVPKLSDVVTHHAFHRIRANLQFSGIYKIMQSIKTDPSIIYMVPDHKRKVFQMRYQEGKVEYFGKKA